MFAAPRSAVRSVSIAVFAIFSLFLLWNFVPSSPDAITGHLRHIQFPLGPPSSDTPADLPTTDLPSSITPPIPNLDEPQTFPTSPSPSHSEAHSETHNNTTIAAFWYKWSQIIHDNAPDVEKIETKTADFKASHRDKDAPRIPFKNLVKNGRADIAAMTESHAGMVQELLSPQNDMPNPFKGQGVAMVGGWKYFGPAINTIKMLRRSGSKLPVEVFVKDRKEYEDYVCDTVFPPLGARCLIITDFLAEGQHVFNATHYQLKVLALLFSSFQDILFIDSDSIPLFDPAKDMFPVEPYKSSGLVLWPDFWDSTESPLFYKIAGLSEFPSNMPMTSSESGQLLWNKRTHLKALLLSVYYNIYGPNHYYPLLSQGAIGEGDKETFLAAAVITNSTYYRVHHGVEAVMNDDGSKSEGRAMLQFHAADEYMLLSNPADPDHFSSSEEEHDESFSFLPGSSSSSSSSTSKSSAGSSSSTLTIRPAFLHANFPKMNAGALIDDGIIFSKEDKLMRWRMLGNRKKCLLKFGFDIEAVLWDFMVEDACSPLAETLRDWSFRKDLCQRVTRHRNELFGEEADGATGVRAKMVKVVGEGEGFDLEDDEE